MRSRLLPVEVFWAGLTGADPETAGGITHLAWKHLRIPRGGARGCD